MIILGLDPGTTTTGFGVIDVIKENVYKTINYGIIETVPKAEQTVKLKEIFIDLQHLIEKHKPNLISVEKIFFNKNPKTVISVSQARGICLLCASLADVPIIEFTPLQVKNNLVGYGRADKKQVQYMVQNILKLKEIPKPDDAADALGLAICGAVAR